MSIQRFPLIQLPKKFKVAPEMINRIANQAYVSINSTSEEV